MCAPMELSILARLLQCRRMALGRLEHIVQCCHNGHRFQQFSPGRNHIFRQAAQQGADFGYRKGNDIHQQNQDTAPCGQADMRQAENSDGRQKIAMAGNARMI